MQNQLNRKLSFNFERPCIREADTYPGTVEIKGFEKKNASFNMPADAGSENTIHFICEVTDSGTPQLTIYQRVAVEIE